MRLSDILSWLAWSIVLSTPGTAAQFATAAPRDLVQEPTATEGDSEHYGRDTPRAVPDGPLVIGYAHNATSGKVEEAIQQGANVVCWSFVDMLPAQAGEKQNGAGDAAEVAPKFETNLNVDAIRSLRERHMHVLHVAAIGGWNGPHPPEGPSGEDWCRGFQRFNEQLGGLFDGVDWDLEGNDDRAARTAKFTLGTLNVMAEFSLCAKHKLGLSVSLAPAESYLDALGPSEFSLWLNLPALAYQDNAEDRAIVQEAGFEHAGMQCYAYVLARTGVSTFDWVSPQLYEAFSRFVHDTTRGHPPISQSHALVTRAEAFTAGFVVYMPDPHAYGDALMHPSPACNYVTNTSNVVHPQWHWDNLRSFWQQIQEGLGMFWSSFCDFCQVLKTRLCTEDTLSGSSQQLKRVVIQVPLEKLVMGVANGWADGYKFCQVQVSELQKANEILQKKFNGQGFRGGMFWTIDEEGLDGIYMARELAEVLQSRREVDQRTDL